VAFEIGPFELSGILGKGGMAVVFSGRHVPDGVPVAIKVMTLDLVRRDRYRRAFLREVRSASRLSHPGIVPILDVGEVPPDVEISSDGTLRAGSPYLVMERVDGGTLDQYAAELNWPSVQWLVLELLDALAHAHALGVVHRDLKPSNVMVELGEDRWHPRLTDFGIARTFDVARPSDPSDDESRVSGTPRYMAPERVTGQWRDQGPWTDLYSLGVMVWKLTTGHAPYRGGTDQVLSAHLSEPLPDYVPAMAVPERLEEWLRGTLAKNAWRRFRSAADAAVAFREVCGSTMRPADALATEPSSPTAASIRSKTPASSMTLPTLTTVMERSARGESLQQRGTPGDWPRPSVPSSWRRSDTDGPSHRLLGAGLGLFGLRTVPLVDRDPERDELWNALVGVIRDRVPRLVTVRGPAGCGKTRLVEWFTRRAAELGAAQTLLVKHSETGGPTDGFGAMLDRLVRCQGLDAEQTLERLRKWIREVTFGEDPIAEYDAVAFAEMIRQTRREPRSEVTTSIEFESPTERWVALRRLLMHLSHERPVILWVEDAHLAPDAVSFVRFLLDDEPTDLPVLIVVNGRTEGPFVTDFVREDLGVLARHPAGTLLNVGRLEDAQLHTLVRRMLGLSSELTDHVVERADGIPMFAVQLLTDWVDEHLLVSGDDGLELSRSRAPRVPDDVHELWLQRLHNVVDFFGNASQEAFDALLLAAVLGRWVDEREWRTATAMFGDSERTDRLLDELLERLVTMGLADRDVDGWSFAHGLMRESLERVAASGARWAEFNRACARSLQTLYDDEEGPGASVVLRIARHLRACDDAVLGLDLTLDAVAAAKKSHDYDWLERLLDAAEGCARDLNLDPSDERRGVIDVSRARVLTTHNHLVEARQLCERLIERADRWGWTKIEGEATFQLGSTVLALGAIEDAVQCYERARELFERLDEPHNLARSLGGKGFALLHQGKWREAKPYVEEAGEIYREIGESRGESFNLFHRGLIARYEGDLERAIQLGEDAARLASRLGFRDTLANALNSLGDLERQRDDLERAREHYRDALDLWSAIGTSATNIGTINLAMVSIQQGDFEVAMEQVEPLVERLESERAGLQLTFALAATLPVYASRGDGAAFDERLARTRELIERLDVHDPDLLVIADRAAREWLARGDDARAAAAAQITVNAERKE
jgi:serine/threonine protein kinase/tetratricopeptide (TPR) repeat protein